MAQNKSLCEYNVIFWLNLFYIYIYKLYKVVQIYILRHVPLPAETLPHHP